MFDETRVASVCAECNTDATILLSLIEVINNSYSAVKRGQTKLRGFEELLTEALRSDNRIDLLSFAAYKTALGKYYSTKRHHPPRTSSFQMKVEQRTSQKARIRVSAGMSMDFKALREHGILTRSSVGYCCTVIHTKRDAHDSDVMGAAEALALAAMNLFRKIPKKKRRRAA